MYKSERYKSKQKPLILCKCGDLVIQGDQWHIKHNIPKDEGFVGVRRIAASEETIENFMKEGMHE